MSTPAQSYSILFSAFLSPLGATVPQGYAVTKSGDGLSYVVASTANLVTSSSGTVNGIQLNTIGNPGDTVQIQRDATVDKSVMPWLGAGIVENAVVDSNGKVQRAGVASGIVIGIVDKEGNVAINLSGAVSAVAGVTGTGVWTSTGGVLNGAASLGTANQVFTTNSSGTNVVWTSTLILSALTITGLAGGGTQMVTVSNTGVLSAQAIPSAGTTVTWATDLVGSTSSSQIVSALTGASGTTTIRSTSGHLSWAAATNTGSFVSWDGTRIAGGRLTQTQATSGAGNHLLIEAQSAATGSNAAGGSTYVWIGKDDGTALGTTTTSLEVWKRGGYNGTDDIELFRFSQQPGGVAAIIGAGGNNGVGGGMAGFQIAAYPEVSVASHTLLNLAVAGLLQNTFFWVQKTDNPTGDDQATQIQYVVDKATSGDDAGLWINRTQNLTHAPGTSRFIDIWNGGTRQGDIRPISGLSGLEINSGTYLHLVGTTEIYGSTGSSGSVQWDTPTWKVAYSGVWGISVTVNTGTGATTIAKLAASPSLTVIADTYQFASGTGPTITSGTGAPVSTPANGSFWLRTDGTSSTTAYVRAAGSWTALGTGGGATSPGGSSTQMQYNNAGSFGGTAEFTYASSVLNCSATGAISFGATPATTAYLRFAQTSTMIAAWGGAANVVFLAGDASNNIWLGGTSAHGSQATNAHVQAGSSVNLDVGASTILAATSTTTTFSGSAFSFSGAAVITQGSSVASTGSFRVGSGWSLSGLVTTDRTLLHVDSFAILGLGGDTSLGHQVANIYLQATSEVDLFIGGTSIFTVISGLASVRGGQNFSVGDYTASMSSATNSIYIKDGTQPTGAPTTGVYMSSDSGSLHFRSSFSSAGVPVNIKFVEVAGGMTGTLDPDHAIKIIIDKPGAAAQTRWLRPYL